ncbi:MAG TPA: RNA polymerase sigma factor [Bryobacteraceae bacterium]
MRAEEREARFEKLIEEHKKILYKICHSYCREPDARDDLAQEILFQLWRSFGGFDGRVKFSTWMYRVGLNVAISFYRRERVRLHHVTAGDQRLLESIPDAERSDEDVHTLYQWIEKMDPLNKALIILYLDGHSYSEISEVLGIRETNVATKISRLKQTLRDEARTKHGTR